MAAISSSALLTGSPVRSVAAQDFLTSFDLLTHSCSLLSLTDLLTLTTVSRLLHTVADSDQVWRPRLLSATRARHTNPPDNTDEQMETAHTEHKTNDSSSSSDSSTPAAVDEPMIVCSCPQHDTAHATTHCKTHYITQFSCTHHTNTRCYHLVNPPPLLLVNRGPRGGMVAMMRARRQAGVSVAVSAGELHCVSGACGSCVAALAEATKDFYDNKSEWAGSFTMTPLSIVSVPRASLEGGGEGLADSASVMDVRYWHVGGYEDTDWRRFTIEWRNSRARQQQPSHQLSESDEKGPLTALADIVSSGVRNAADSVRRAIASAQPSSCTPSNDDGMASEERSATADGWHVVSMAPFCSGKWAYHSPANVVVTDALRYSRLPRVQQPRQRGGRARPAGRFAAPLVPLRRPRNEQQQQPPG